MYLEKSLFLLLHLFLIWHLAVHAAKTKIKIQENELFC